jgi:hypothetical protein
LIGDVSVDFLAHLSKRAFVGIDGLLGVVVLPLKVYLEFKRYLLVRNQPYVVFTGYNV